MHESITAAIAEIEAADQAFKDIRSRKMLFRRRRKEQMLQDAGQHFWACFERLRSCISEHGTYRQLQDMTMRAIMIIWFNTELGKHKPAP